MDQQEYLKLRKDRGEIVGALYAISQKVFDIVGDDPVSRHYFFDIQIKISEIVAWSDYLLNANFPGISGGMSGLDLAEHEMNSRKVLSDEELENLTPRDFLPLGNRLIKMTLDPIYEIDEEEIKFKNFISLFNKDCIEVSWKLDNLYRLRNRNG